MNRRGFFALLIAPFLSRFLPHVKFKPRSLGFTSWSFQYDEDIEVLNRGDLAVFKLLDADIKTAMDTMSRILAEEIFWGKVSLKDQIRLRLSHPRLSPTRIPA